MKQPGHREKEKKKIMSLIMIGNYYYDVYSTSCTSTCMNTIIDNRNNIQSYSIVGPIEIEATRQTSHFIAP